jgi:acyl carrier protein
MSRELTKKEKELLELILEACRIDEDEDLTDFDPDSPLFGPDSFFGLDSLDAVEIAVTVQNKYDVKMSSNDSDNIREIMKTLKVLSDYVNKTE